MDGDAYPVPFGYSQTSDGGNCRLSPVSAETALCDGPRSAGQSPVTAPGGSGFGLRANGSVPTAPPAASACTASACNSDRREISDSCGTARQRDGGPIGGWGWPDSSLQSRPSAPSRPSPASSPKSSAPSPEPPSPHLTCDRVFT